MRRSWRLNERHYGELQGKDKKETAEEFGEEKLQRVAPLLRRAAAAARSGTRRRIPATATFRPS